MNRSYSDFLSSKSQLAGNFGFKPNFLPNFLYDFQLFLVDWSLRKGRSAIFADCGLGKTPIQLVWAENIVRKTNKPVLIIAPLAVSQQTIREGEKFDIEVKRSKEGKIFKGINITNYERLHYFNSNNFGGVVCDESSAIKQFAGARKKEVTNFLHKIPYRLLCTATAAPNDYIELGTHSEALGCLGQMDMLSTFFRSTDNMQHVFNRHGDFWNTHKWMFKVHSEQAFWKWVCTWARALRKPSDFNFNDDKFILPKLNIEQTIIKNIHIPKGKFFLEVAKTFREQRKERKVTLRERCEKVAEKVYHKNSAVVWCQLNDEGDLLERLIPDAKQIKGANTDEEKEKTFNAFSTGELRVLITKPRIGGFGLNWQHCSHMTFFPSHSFEQYYQAIRRCWRFGQTKSVKVDIITTDGEAGVTANLQNKSNAAEKMFTNLVKYMNNELKINKMNDKNNKWRSPKWM